jgi:uncharacterized protein YecE (DUF72 family)
MPFNRDQMKAAAAALAAKGVYLGTSSWKYTGWQGQLYDESRYIWRGRFSKARFEKYCLAEYAQVFKTVCVDAGYYKFRDCEYLKAMVSDVPPDFLFAFKVTDQITIKRFANLPRFGPRAGGANQDFLNPTLLQSAFLEPCVPFRSQIGLMIFEFSRFYATDFERGRDFVEALDQFFGQLPKGWPYGVEMRNRNFLHPDYFAMLARHGITHIYNSWQDMPSLQEQLDMPDSRTNLDLMGARLLLRPGRKYEEAVKMFRPYDRIKEIYPEGRVAGAKLVREAMQRSPPAKTFIYVNNRFEGNALETISAIVEEAALK